LDWDVALARARLNLKTPCAAGRVRKQPPLIIRKRLKTPSPPAVSASGGLIARIHHRKKLKTKKRAAAPRNKQTKISTKQPSV